MILLINELIKNNLISDLVARDAELSLKNGEELSIDDALATRGVDFSVLSNMRATMYGIPEYKNQITITEDLLRYVSEEFSRRYFVLPIAEQSKEVLLIGIVDPENKDILDALQAEMSKSAKGYTLNIISMEQFRKGLESYYVSSAVAPAIPSSTTQNISTDTIADLSKSSNIKEDTIDLTDVKGEITEETKNQPIEDIVNTILRTAIDMNASDIHIEPMETELRFRYRVDGELLLGGTLTSGLQSAVVARFKILSGMKLDEKRKPQDGRFSSRLDNHKIDYRASILPGYYGEKVVIRILDSYRGVKPLHELGFSESHLVDIRKALSRPYGLILISGPTGSGKTTTLYSMLHEIDRKGRNVVSLEDPIEYNLGDVTQSQIFPEIGYTFATGLRSILRQDPDVIMVGEIRDAETAQLAIQAALTGHLVFSTIHTNNAIGVIPRLMDMGVDPYMIAPTLCLALAQRLVRRTCPSSENAIEYDPAKRAFVDEAFKDLPDEFKAKLNITKNLSEAIPSNLCPTGVKGRIPVVESIYITNAMQKAILEKKNEGELWATARASGAISMKEDAILKCMEGIIPFVEINSL
jgi:type IV pilus assembly protein PilB